MRALLKKELLEISRSKKLLILLIIFLFVAISSPILAKLIPTIFKNMQVQGITLNIPEPTWKDAIDQFVKNISQIVMIVIVFLFAGAIAEEKNKKTLEIVLTKPISRTNIVLSKMAAALLSTFAIYAICGLIFYLYTASVFTTFPFVSFLLMAGIILLYLFQVITITIFSSSLTSNQIIAAGISFFFEIIIVTILGSIDKISKYMPGYILGRYKDIMAGDHSGLLPSVLIMAGIIIISTIGAILIFRKQEIER